MTTTAVTFEACPIGILRCDMSTKFAAPHQPRGAGHSSHRIELHSGENFEQGLRDLEGFERIWIISWFHRNSTWKPLVLPPRGPAQKRGVFATRSPHRPNAIGLTCVPLIRIKGRTLWVGETDLVDGTPILDIKPYIPTVDAFPSADAGWVGVLEHKLETTPGYDLKLSSRAQAQLEWLASEFSVHLMPRLREILSIDPTPHRTRRIIKSGNRFRMGCGAWRIFYSIEDTHVQIEELTPGYPLTSLQKLNTTPVHDREAQLAFYHQWVSNSSE